MYKKLILAFILLLNHSMMFGVTEAAHIPDEEHPQGYAFHTEDDQLDLDVMHLLDHAFQQVSSQTEIENDSAHHTGHDHHHKHGAHIHLNCELPYSLQFDFQHSGGHAPIARLTEHQSLSFSPPVPPPNN